MKPEKVRKRETRPGEGKPPHRPSDFERRQVETMSSFGIPQEDIANVLRITDKTLRKYYSHEIATAKAKANSMVAQNLFRKATGDTPQAVVAAIFWLKTRAGWKEPPTETVNDSTVRIEGGLPDKEP